MTEKELYNEQQWKMLVFSLNQIRISKGITQQEIEYKTGIARQAVNRFFNCKNKPSLPLFLEIADAVGIDVSIIEKSKKIL